MTDHPILFQGDMVQAIMTCARCGTVTLEIECPKCGSKERRKTQTRRVIKDMPETWHLGKGAFGGSNPHGNEEFIIHGDCGENEIHCRHYPGDLLGVREKWRPLYRMHTNVLVGACFRWRGGGRVFNSDHRNSDSIDDLCSFKSPLHMFKWATQIWLKVKSVRVEYLQDISWQDCKAEGITLIGDELVFNNQTQQHSLLRTKFKCLWDSINASPKPRYRTINGKKQITHYESYPWANIRQTRRYRDKPWHVYGNPHIFATEFERYDK